jgi:hypothetical protein
MGLGEVSCENMRSLDLTHNRTQWWVLVSACWTHRFCNRSQSRITLVLAPWGRNVDWGCLRIWGWGQWEMTNSRITRSACSWSRASQFLFIFFFSGITILCGSRSPGVFSPRSKCSTWIHFFSPHPLTSLARVALPGAYATAKHSSPSHWRMQISSPQ